MGKKLKTNKSMAKRIKVTKTGKLMHQKAYVSHLLKNKWDVIKKDKYRKEISSSEAKKIKNLLPYK